MINAKQKREAWTISLDTAQFGALMIILHNLVKVMASSQVKREDGTDRNARFLKVFGLTENEIADLLGVTRQAVNKALKKKTKMRKKKVKGIG